MLTIDINADSIYLNFIILGYIHRYKWTGKIASYLYYKIFISMYMNIFFNEIIAVTLRQYNEQISREQTGCNPIK